MTRPTLSAAVALGLALVLVPALVACKKETRPEPAGPTPVTAGTIGADGVRRVAVDAGKEGYRPDRILGKPGEKLVLVFTRTYDAACIAQLKTPDGKLVDLPKGSPVDVPVTVPATGEVGFACGMDMFHGAVVAAAPSLRGSGTRPGSRPPGRCRRPCTARTARCAARR